MNLATYLLMVNMQDLNIKHVLSVVVFTFYISSCTNYQSEKNYVFQINDSLRTYKKYDSLWNDFGESTNHSNNKFLKLRDSIFNIIEKNSIEIRDSIILRTIEIHNGPCPVLRWVPMDGRRYIRIPKFNGGPDSIKSFFQQNFRKEIFKEVRDKRIIRNFTCNFSVIQRPEKIVITTNEKDSLLVYPYLQELIRIVHILPCWNVDNFILAESKDSLIDNLSVRKQFVSFDIILNKNHQNINVENFLISDKNEN